MILQKNRWNLLTEIGMILTMFNKKAIVEVQSPELTLLTAFRIWVATTLFRLNALSNTNSLEEIGKPICQKLIDCIVWTSENLTC